jgi:hypothetical protein
MKDYKDIGFTNRLRPENSISGRPSSFETALTSAINREPSPYLNRTSISNRGGTLQTNLGGVFEVRDTTGGTVLLTIDPDTGTVTIAGAIQASVTLNLGTINNTSISGSGTIDGTLTNNRLINGGTINNGTLGTPAITGGTIDSVVMGTPDITGGSLDSAVLGTPAITGGTHDSAVFGTPDMTGGSLDSAVLGTPDITGGTADTITLGTPTVVRPTINGTPTFGDINAGSAALSANGDFQLQSHGTATVLTWRGGGTTFYVDATGTI